jgi:arylsulfatase A-like enzyme
LRETTIVVVTADHGEEFLQHGDLGHGWSLYQELLHVPLVVALPREPASMFEGPFKGSVDAPVSIVDVAPTVLDLLGLGQEPSMDGRSLVPLLIDRAESDSWPERGLFFETIWGEHVEIAADLPQPGERPQGDSGGWVKGPERPIRANYRTGLAEKQLKILHDQLADSWELFDLSQDPLEKRNLFGGHPQERQLLERLLQMESRFGASPESRLAKPAAVEMDAEEIEELAALGYLE